MIFVCAECHSAYVYHVSTVYQRINKDYPWEEEWKPDIPWCKYCGEIKELKEVKEWEN